MNQLIGRIVDVQSLSDTQKERMFELLTYYFANVEWRNFERDLAEKNWVIILESRKTGQIQGFSTILLLERVIEGETVKAVFSGDTIIDRHYWGEQELARVWLNFVYSLVKEFQGIKFYWYLISKGYKTYRFLPVYFYEFYPCYNRVTPAFEKKVLDIFGQLKFPGQYNAETGIISFETLCDYLKPGIADITAARLKAPHVRYFAEKNPGYRLGDELACITELSEANLKPAGHKLLKKGNRQEMHDY